MGIPASTGSVLSFLPSFPKRAITAAKKDFIEPKRDFVGASALLSLPSFSERELLIDLATKDAAKKRENTKTVVRKTSDFNNARRDFFSGFQSMLNVGVAGVDAGAWLATGPTLSIISGWSSDTCRLLEA